MIWFVYVLLSAFSTSLSAIFDKIAIKGADSTVTATIYMVISAIFLIGFTAIFKRNDSSHLQSLSAQNMPVILLSGSVYALSWLFYIYALKHGSVTKVAITDLLSLLFTTLLGSLILGECLKIQQIIGAVFITIGAYLVVMTI